MNTRYSLHKIYTQENCPFDANGYSYFKFGDKSYAKKFATDLFSGFIAVHAQTLLNAPEIVLLPSIYIQ